MSGTLVIIAADGTEIERVIRTREPSLSELSAAVGGYIELVPHGVNYRGRPRDAYVNEDGRGLALPRNAKGSKLWVDTLGAGPFWYTPEVFGALAIWIQDEAEPMTEGEAEEADHAASERQRTQEKQS